MEERRVGWRGWTPFLPLTRDSAGVSINIPRGGGDWLLEVWLRLILIFMEHSI